MKAKIVLLGLVLSAAVWADVVTLKNGDKITGAIVKKDGGNLTMKTALAGTVTIAWDQITSIQTDGPITVVTGGRTVQAPISMQGDRVQVQGQGVALGDITALRDAAEQRAFERLERPGWGELWTGTAGLNFGGATGNAETRTFLVNANAIRASRTDKTVVYFTAINSSATINNVNTQTAQAVRGGWAYSRNLGPKLFANVFNDWEYNKFQLLDLRFVLGGGLGYHAWKSERGQLDLVGGVAYARDKFSAVVGPTTASSRPAYTDSRAELYYGNDFNYKVSSNTTFNQSWRMFHSFEDFGAYRMNFDAGANTQITKWLTWNIGVSNRYLANPPFGRKNNDFLYSTGIGISFAR